MKAPTSDAVNKSPTLVDMGVSDTMVLDDELVMATEVNHSILFRVGGGSTVSSSVSPCDGVRVALRRR